MRSNIHISIICILLLFAACGNRQTPSQGSAGDTIELSTPIVADSSSIEPKTYPHGFVSISDLISDAILDIRYYGNYNFVGTRIDGYLAPKALFSAQAADSLVLVANDLRRQGYCIKVYDAYRPQKAVDHFMRWVSDPADTLMRQNFYPMVSKSRMVNKYIARHSAHTRGAAIDLTLVDIATGQDLDMGGTFDWFGKESHPDYCGDPNRMVYYPRENGLTEQQFNNRMLLRRAMLAHGFKPIKSEWWHFSLAREPFPNTYFDFDIK